MKKLVVLFCCVALLFAVASLGFAKGEKEGEMGTGEMAERVAIEGKPITIGYSCISWTIPWMVFYKDLFEKEIAKYPQYEVIWHDAGFDFEVMADGLENFIDQDVDVILHFALDSLPMIETYKKIVDAGIPLILTMDPPDYKAYDYMTSFSGLDTRDAGRQCALMLEEELGGKGNIALITAPKGSSSELQYTAGFKNELTRLKSLQSSPVTGTSPLHSRWRATYSPSTRK
jgi:ABC-type sugar transport system substrate-binding protein